MHNVSLCALSGFGHCCWHLTAGSRGQAGWVSAAAIPSHLHNAIHWAQQSWTNPWKYQLWSLTSILV